MKTTKIKPGTGVGEERKQNKKLREATLQELT